METTSPSLAAKTASPWTENRVRRLVDLWSRRVSAAEIARALGHGLSRSAVVGKLSRLGLAGVGEQRRTAQSDGARLSLNLKRRTGVHPPVLPTVPLPPPTPCAVVPRLIRLSELGRTSCRWPYDAGEGTRFCGHAAAPAGPYCADHHAIAYGAVLPPLTPEALEAAGPARPGRRTSKFL